MEILHKENMDPNILKYKNWTKQIQIRNSVFCRLDVQKYVINNKVSLK